MEKKKVEQLSEFAERCHRFSLICQERVNLLEGYKNTADATIKTQEEQIYIAKEELKSEQTKNKFIIPGLSLLAGLALGFVIAR